MYYTVVYTGLSFKVMIVESKHKNKYNKNMNIYHTSMCYFTKLHNMHDSYLKYTIYKICNDILQYVLQTKKMEKKRRPGKV